MVRPGVLRGTHLRAGAGRLGGQAVPPRGSLMQSCTLCAKIEDPRRSEPRELGVHYLISRARSAETSLDKDSRLPSWGCAAA